MSVTTELSHDPHKRDLTSNFIVLELQRQGLPYLRLNTEDFPKGTFHCRPGLDDAWHFELEGASLNLALLSRPRTFGVRVQPNLFPISMKQSGLHSTHLFVKRERQPAKAISL